MGKNSCVYALFAFLGLTAVAGGAPAGEADVHPVVHGDSSTLLGGSADGAWLDAGKVAPRLRGGELYRHYGLFYQLGAGDGPAPQSTGDPCSETMLVEMLLPSGDTIVSVAGEWNAMPRVPKSLNPEQPVYRKAVAEWLVGAGMTNLIVELEQIIRVDLEGDGVDEVLLTANHRAPRRDENDFGAMAGDYSFVLLRRLRDGKLETLTLSSDVHADPRPGDINYFYRLAAVLDLNGDGVMEIVVEDGYYEGEGVGVITVESGEPEMVLHAGCGA